jgi:predicted HicB family RNase H-like nuclease
MKMNEKILSYKDYFGSVEFSLEDQCLFGKVLHISDLINYEADTIPALENAFRQCVDDYVLFCKEQGDVPELPYKGVFNVRVGPNVHRCAAIEASKRGISLNEYVKDAIVSYSAGVSSAQTRLVTHRHHHAVTHTVVTSAKVESESEYAVIPENNSWTRQVITEGRH